MEKICVLACYDMVVALQENGIDYRFTPWYDGNGGQFKFPAYYKSGDIVCHNGSFGGSVGLFESWHFPWDKGSVTGFLTIEEFITLFKKEYMV